MLSISEHKAGTPKPPENPRKPTGLGSDCPVAVNNEDIPVLLFPSFQKNDLQ